MLLLLPAGASGEHAGTHDFRGITIQGTFIRSVEGGPDEKELPPGSYLFQPTGQLRKSRCVGPEDCVIFIHRHGMGDMPRPSAAR